MNPVSTQLELTAASIRLAGYVLERQLRVAQVLGKAAVSSNPFAIPLDLRKVASKPKPAKVAVDAANPAPVEPVTARQLAVKPIAGKALRKDKPAKAKPANKSIEQVTPKKRTATRSAEAKTPSAAQALPETKAPAMKVPEFKSRTSKSPTPVNVKTKDTAKLAGTAAVKAIVQATPVQDQIAKALDKNTRAPASPPSMPARGKVASQD